MALTITKDLQASFQVINAQTGLPSDWNTIYTAVAGSPNVPPGQVPPTQFNTGLLMAGATSISNVVKDISAKKVVDHHELIASTFWIRCLTALRSV